MPNPISEHDDFWSLQALLDTQTRTNSDLQLRRLLNGISSAVAQKGYAATTVADVIKIAGVSRKTFYELFKDKEDCYLTAYKLAHGALLEDILNAQQDFKAPIDKLRAAHTAYLNHFEQFPNIGRAFVVEIYAAGPRANEYRQQAHQEFVLMHQELQARWRRDSPQLPQLPDEVFIGLVGSHISIINQAISNKPKGGLISLLPTLLYLCLACYGVADQAYQELEHGNAENQDGVSQSDNSDETTHATADQASS